MDNLVFHPDRPEVLAVLGWKLSTLGDPISDLANNCMAYFLPPHFSALRGTERGKVVSGTWREELEFRNRLAAAQRAQLAVGLIAAGNCSALSPLHPSRVEISLCMCRTHCAMVTSSPFCLISATHLVDALPCAPCPGWYCHPFPVQGSLLAVMPWPQ